jgi:hypothetical protein
MSKASGLTIAMSISLTSAGSEAIISFNKATHQNLQLKPVRLLGLTTFAT